MIIDPSDLLLQISNSTSGLTSNVIEQAVDQTQDTLYGGLAAAGTAISGITAKIFHDNKKNKENEQAIDFDFEQFMDLKKLEDDYTLKYPDKTRADILKLSAYPDEPSLTINLAQAYAQFRQEWKDYNKKKYYQNK